MKRTGMSIVEMLAAVAILGGGMTLTLQMLALHGAQRASLQRRDEALQEAANLLERVAALPWEELEAERLASFELSPSTRTALPDAELTIDVQSPADEPDCKCVAVAIAWHERPARHQRPVRLVAWFYRALAEVEP